MIWFVFEVVSKIISFKGIEVESGTRGGKRMTE